MDNTGAQPHKNAWAGRCFGDLTIITCILWSLFGFTSNITCFRAYHGVYANPFGMLFSVLSPPCLKVYMPPVISFAIYSISSGLHAIPYSFYCLSFRLAINIICLPLYVLWGLWCSFGFYDISHQYGVCIFSYRLFASHCGVYGIFLGSGAISRFFFFCYVLWFLWFSFYIAGFTYLFLCFCVISAFACKHQKTQHSTS